MSHTEKRRKRTTTQIAPIRYRHAHADVRRTSVGWARDFAARNISMMPESKPNKKEMRTNMDENTKIEIEQKESMK
jgi:hypothetical protein